MKDTIKGIKNKPWTGEKYLQVIPDKELVSRVCVKFLKLTDKKNKHSNFKKQAKDMNKHLTKEQTGGKLAYENTIKIKCHWGKAN